MKKKIFILLALCIAAAGAYYAVNRFQGSRSGAADNKDVVYVNRVSDITGSASSDYRERFGGVIEPQATVKIKLDAEKKVKECKVKEGDQVKEGQTLFVYDTREDANKLAQLEIDIETEKSEIASDTAAIARLEKEKRSASADDQLSYTTDILTQQNNIKMSEYEIKTKTLEIEQLKETLQHAEVKSEVSGIVQTINPPDSDSMNSSDGTYMKILKSGDFRIKCKLNEQNLPMVTEGMPVVVFSRLDRNQAWKGTVTEVITDNTQEDDGNAMVIGDSGSTGSSNYRFYVQADSIEGMLLGQHVYLEEDKGQETEKEGLWLNEAYLTREDGKFFVWRADESERIRRQEVTVGEYDGEQEKYQILSGLAAEDSIAFPMDGIQEGSQAVLNVYDSSADGAVADEASGDDTGDDDSAEVIEDNADDDLMEDDANVEVIEDNADDDLIGDDANAEVIEDNADDDVDITVVDELDGAEDVQE